MKQSIKPIIWGPHGWEFMHYVSFGYPDNPSNKDKNDYKTFYYSLQNILPCEKCSENYKLNLIHDPIDNHLDSRDSLIKWVIDIHNKVNKETGEKVLNYEEAISLYSNEESSFIENCVKLTIVLLIILIIYLFSKSKFI